MQITKVGKRISLSKATVVDRSIKGLPMMGGKRRFSMMRSDVFVSIAQPDFPFSQIITGVFSQLSILLVPASCLPSTCPFRPFLFPESVSSCDEFKMRYPETTSHRLN